MLNPLLVIVITVNVLPRCFLSLSSWFAELFGFCFDANSKILIEFTAKKAASTPEQHADPIKIKIISKINP
jgi:hypothetical protein